MKRLCKKDVQLIVDEIENYGCLQRLIENEGVPEFVVDTELEPCITAIKKNLEIFETKFGYLCNLFGAE